MFNLIVTIRSELYNNVMARSLNWSIYRYRPHSNIYLVGEYNNYKKGERFY